MGIHQLRNALPQWLEEVENGLSDNFRYLLYRLAEDLRYFEDRISELDKQITQHVQKDRIARRLLALRGVGPIVASVLSIALADAKSFKRGRDFAASIGLTPRQHSTGGKNRLLGISKR